jgi:hypothetical protein
LLVPTSQSGHHNHAQRPAIRLSLTGHQSCRATHKPNYPTGTKLLILGDNSAEGHKKAEAAAIAHRGRGSIVLVTFPPAGVKDSNDLLREHGVDAVRAWIEAAMQSPRAAATPGLAARYPAPTEDRDAALTRQKESIKRILQDGARLAAARRDVITRRAVILAQMGDDVGTARSRDAPNDP